MENFLDDIDEVEVPRKAKSFPERRKLAPWREAERYFKRFRDKEKVIPLRPQGYGKVNT